MLKHAFRSCITLSAAALLWCATDSVSLAAKSPVPVDGTAWLTIGKLKARASRLGGFSTAGEGEVDFSIDAAPGLPLTGDFTAAMQDLAGDVGFRVVVPGQYSQDEKGKMQLVPETDALPTQVEDIIMSALTSQGIFPDAVTAEVLKASAKAKTGYSTKVGEYLKFKFMAKTAVTVTFGAESAVLKVNMSYNGMGTKGV